MTNLKRDGDFTPTTWHGTTEEGSSHFSRILVAPNQQALSESSTKTSNLQSCSLYLHQVPLEESQCWNGNTYSKEKLLISTKSSHHSIVFQLICGDTEISIGGSETKRKVETSSEWSTKW